MRYRIDELNNEIEENFKVPKILFDDNKYRNLSTNSKLLYSILINLKDFDNKELMKLLNVTKPTFIKSLNELINNGLIYKNNKGYVYFITTNYKEYKIGLSTNLEKRMGEYTNLPYKPITIHLIKSNDCYLTEKLFHEYFKEKRLRGEWFKLNDKDIKFIKSEKYTKEIIESIGE